jgi:threonine/homoserine/homoserine lactone efflux protein
MTIPALGLFFFTVLGVIALPGLDMAFVLASALTGGRRHGLIAVAGIVLGGLIHTVVGGLGISALLLTLPIAYDALLVVGALYLAFVGIQVFRTAREFMVTDARRLQTSNHTFARALTTCLLNPKAYVFTLAILPQFIRTNAGTAWNQIAVLWVIIAVTQVMVYGSLALLAQRVAPWLHRNPKAQPWVTRAVGCILLLVATTMPFYSWHNA